MNGHDMIKQLEYGGADQSLFNPERSKAFREQALELVTNSRDLYTIHHQVYPSLGHPHGSIGRAAFQCWRACVGDSHFGVPALMVLKTSILSSSAAEIAEFDERLLVGQTWAATSTIIAALAGTVEQVIRDDPIAVALSITYSLIQHTEIRKIRAAWGGLLPAIKRTLRRQLCSGSDEFTWKVLNPGFAHLTDILMYDWKPPQSAKDLQVLFHPRELTLIASSAAYAAQQKDTEAINGFRGFLKAYIMGSQRISGYITNFYAQMASLIASWWYPLLSTLNSLDPAIASLRQVVLQIMVEFGSHFGLTANRFNVIPADLDELAQIKPYARVCHWSLCPCRYHYDPFTRSHLHSIRVCKGCWSVFYCSRKCQSQDWSTHKAACLKSRS